MRTRDQGWQVAPRLRWITLCFAAGCTAWMSLAACRAPAPPAHHAGQLALPAPTAVETAPREERLATNGQGQLYELTPRRLIPIAFNRQPGIKSSYRRYKAEEARYEFFYASRDSLTPKMSVMNRWAEDRFVGATDGWPRVNRANRHAATLSVEKLFFDTTEMELGMGYRLTDENVAYGSRPFATASLRYPLWASRERLERTSEEIFRRNELNDTQLAFIQTVRRQLQSTLNTYYVTIYNGKLYDAAHAWRRDLESLLARLDEAQMHDVQADRRRVEAEIARVRSKEAGYDSFRKINAERLKGACGLPFHVQVECRETPFDPFADLTHEELFQLGIETDPEIATLRNARENARVQLQLARRGRWDVALIVNGQTDLEGQGVDASASNWALSAGIEVSAVDPRVTRSLIRQAQSDIERFTEAMAARENEIFVNTLEPKVRNTQLAETLEELRASRPSFIEDYREGVVRYLAGQLNIDNLLERRSVLFEHDAEIAMQAFYMGMNTSSLCAETGAFFELLNGDENG